MSKSWGSLLGVELVQDNAVLKFSSFGEEFAVSAHTATAVCTHAGSTRATDIRLVNVFYPGEDILRVSDAFEKIMLDQS